MKIRIATRGSQLALWQSNWVKRLLTQYNPGTEVELITMKTKGDKILDVPLAKIGGKGLFVKELETAILEGEADIAVHSMKDVPIELPPNLEISTVTKRAEARDAFVSNKYSRFQDLPYGAVVGTSSLRRVSQLKYERPDLTFKDLRGNVNTRLKKLDDGEFDAIILAGAGLERLDFHDRIAEYLPVELSLPSVGQGVVGIESRCDEKWLAYYLGHLQDEITGYCVEAERAFLTRLNGGCQMPVAGYCIFYREGIVLDGMLAMPDGSKMVRQKIDGSKHYAKDLGIELAELLLRKGGKEILDKLGIEVKM